MRIHLPSIDPFSLTLGIILASVFWLIISALRPIFRQIGENIRIRREKNKTRTRNLDACDEHYRRYCLRQAQGMHMAAPLFALDEIIIPPLLLAPPPRVEPGRIPRLSDVVSQSIPYLPAWPELACIYRADTITLSEALSGDLDIVLTGQPGSGKTVALAQLASLLARKDGATGLPPETLPILIHAADLELPLKKVDEPLIPLLSQIVDKMPIFDGPRIPDFIRASFEEARVLLMLDGTDELTSNGLSEVVKYIKAIKRTYPKTRIVTTANPEYLDGLVTLNFVPFAMAAWGPERERAFLEKWGRLWEQYITVETWAQAGPETIDPILLNHWIIAEGGILTPLEITLKTWAVYAGDVSGGSLLDAIESHLNRATPVEIPREAVENLALQVHLASEPIFDHRHAREWTKSFEPAEMVSLPEDNPPGKKNRRGEKSDLTVAPSQSLIGKLVQSGLLAQHRSNRVRFIHPVLGGYLAGGLLGDYKPQTILEQSPWIGKYLSMHYLAARGDASNFVDHLLSKTDRPFERNILTAARWLRDAPRSASWRGNVMARLADLLQHEGQPLALRGQALSAFISANDPAVASLFRHMLQSQSAELLQLAVLGSGAMHDAKAVPDLSGLVNHFSPNVGRAACLALVLIGTSEAIDGVADALLHGEESLRRAASESLANHPADGYAILKEGTQVSDLLVRRAVTYGLGRVSQPWADELLAKLQLEEKEWIVRNSAAEALENKNNPNPHIPRRLPPPSESPWLLEFAGKQGVGITPDKPPIDILINVLDSGSDEERLAAIAYLRMYPTEPVFGALFHTMYSGDIQLREAAFLTLWEMSARGVDVPDPAQFGVG